MDRDSMLAVIDAEIEKLQRARTMLAGLIESPLGKAKSHKGRMSAEARKRIADAQRKRWAAARAKKQSRAA